jgi:hypothetical protein
MSKSSLLAWPVAAAMLFASYSWPVLAQAKPGADTSQDDPADAAIRVRPLVYQSSFATYQAFSEQEVKAWRESNDNVGRIGGWRAYAKEAQKPAIAAPAASSKPASQGPARWSDVPDALKHHH